MSKSTKVVSLIAAIVVLAGAIAAIAVAIASNDPSNPKPGFYQDGKRSDPGIVMTVNGHDIDFNEYRYFYLSQKNQLTYSLGEGDSTYWDNDADGTKASKLKEETEKYIKYIYAWIAEGEKQGISLSEEEKANLDKALKQSKKEHGTGFDYYLQTENITNEQTYAHIMEIQTLYKKIKDQVTADFSTTHADELKSTVVTAEHILFAFDNYGGDTEAAKEAADEAMAEIRDSADPVATFEALRAPVDGGESGYGNDPGQTVDGYTFGSGTMVEEFYQGALALGEDEISEPIETTYGYHIILRRALNEDAFEADKDSMLAGGVDQVAKEYINGVMETLTITYGEYYDKMTPASVK